ncbi:MAG: FAD-binding protein [Stigonema ocellatum SAG 48.90 = DSM 106950]|nr:FAD-binding protein [Stigonema ocellatum SAG 48.90 = DSM 106950]
MMTNFEFPTINYDVVIVGGGISGLTLACGLRSSGLQILVVEAQQEQQVYKKYYFY